MAESFHGALCDWPACGRCRGWTLMPLLYTEDQTTSDLRGPARKNAAPRAHATEGISDTGELSTTVPCVTVPFNPEFELAVSTARFATYRAVARGDDHAWELYRWNTELAAALAPLTVDLEVTLRNTIHRQLCSHFGRDDWWSSNDLILDDDTYEVLVAALEKHRKAMSKGTLTPSRVVADLMFGVWVMLLGRGGVSTLGRTADYETKLWGTTLWLGFDLGTRDPKGRARRPSSDDVHTRAATYQRLRNRAAHHEPLFVGVHRPGAQRSSPRVPLIDIWHEGVELLSWMAPNLAELHRTAARFAVGRHRPS